jgi:hypothetical protein
MLVNIIPSTLLPEYKIDYGMRNMEWNNIDYKVLASLSSNQYMHVGRLYVPLGRKL